MNLTIDVLMEAKRKIDTIVRPPRIEIWLDDFMEKGACLTGDVSAFGGNSFHPDSEKIYIIHPDSLKEIQRRAPEERPNWPLTFLDIPVYRSGKRVEVAGIETPH